AENKFSLLISLDGPEEIHDRNRTFASNGNGTFKTIMKNISKFKSVYEGYVDKYIRFNAVLDGTSDFECTKKFFSEYDDVKDFRVNLSSMAENYSKEERRVNEDVMVSTGYERFKVLLNKVGRLDEKYVSKL
ncbi:MAG TPA: Cys-rich peptide radical SAM maturase CcpM, partial [Clostridium sp.]|nr:Cys-rich peptide radical SAM maturase CcpM [Clostridium sp.]